MKTTTLFRTLLLSLLMAAMGNGAMAQETEYHPFADNAVWSVNNIKYATHGDTTICGRNYLKVYRQEEDHPFDFDVEQAEYFCAIRNDTAAQRVYRIYREAATVYYYNPNEFLDFQNYVSTDTTEFLLYDFSLAEGDTTTIASFDDIYDSPGIYLYIVSPFHSEYDYDITLSDTTIRKVHNMEIMYLPVMGGRTHLEWIEGIGNIDGTFTIGDIFGVWESSYLELICYELDGNLLLSRPQAEYDNVMDCFSMGNVGIAVAEKTEMAIYPNPTNGHVSISLSNTQNNTIKKVAVYTITGQMVYSNIFNSQSIEMDIRNYPSGMYVIEITVDSGDVLQTKIIKQ